MATENTGSASPTADAGSSPQFNPVIFDESELAKVLSERFADKPVEEGPKPETPSGETQEEEVVQGTNEKPDVDPQLEDTEAPSQDQETEDKVEEPEWFQKRIDKITAKTKEAIEAAEQRVAELEAKLAEKSEEPVVINNDTPLGNVWDLSKLEAERQKARQVRRWCEDNSDGAVVGDREYSKEEIRNIQRRVTDMLEDHVPQRAEYLNRYKHASEVTQELYPWWKDSKSKEYAEANNLLREFPQLRSLPEHKLLISDFMLGKATRLAKAAEAKSPKKSVAVVKQAPRQPSTPSAAPVKKDASDKKKAALSRFARSGGESELAELLEGMV